jgi:hypothetical protein
MSHLRAVSLAIVCAFAFLAFFVPVQAAESELECWKLSQWTREDGNLDLYVSKSAVRIFCPKNGLCVVAAAPWKEVSLFCTKTGNAFKTTPEKFHNPYLTAMGLFQGGSFAEIIVALRGPVKHLDLPCRMMIEQPGFSQRQISRHKSAIIGNRSPLKLEYIVTNYFKADPHVGQVISKFYTTPVTNSVPLELTYTTMVSTQEKQLTTSSCKRIKVNASEFTVPAGMKAVNDSKKVLVPDQSDGSLDLMMMGRSKFK